MIVMACLNKVNQLLLHLFLSKGVGVKTVNKFVRKIQSDELFDPTSLYSFSAEDFEKVFSLDKTISQNCVAGLADFSTLEQEISKVGKQNINILTLLDQGYPKHLRMINTPPPILFFQGDLSFYDDLVLSVVGARKADSYGKRALEKVLPTLVSSGWSIVSGGALGIDTLAHSVTLAAKGRTAVVVGSGLGVVYPECNKKIFEQVVGSGGAIVSIFPYDTQPDRFNFPVRNRVIAGMGMGCLVVQAAKESGSLITAKYALEENREVFAIPGPIDSELSQGCHDLIRQGAHLVESYTDIFAAFEFKLDQFVNQEIKHFDENRSQNLLMPMQDLKQSVLDKHLSSLSLQILDLLFEPKTSDEICEVLKVEQKVLVDILFDLELEGFVVRNFNGTWEKS